MNVRRDKIMSKMFTLNGVICLLLCFSIIQGCSRPPEDMIFKDFMSIVKINPNTGGPRAEWEESKTAGYEVNRIYNEKDKTIVVLKLNKSYYGRGTVLMFYEKLSDGTWKWKGWNMKKE